MSVLWISYFSSRNWEPIAFSFRFVHDNFFYLKIFERPLVHFTSLTHDLGGFVESALAQQPSEVYFINHLQMVTIPKRKPLYNFIYFPSIFVKRPSFLAQWPLELKLPPRRLRGQKPKEKKRNTTQPSEEFKHFHV